MGGGPGKTRHALGGRRRAERALHLCRYAPRVESLCQRLAGPGCASGRWGDARPAASAAVAQHRRGRDEARGYPHAGHRSLDAKGL